MIDDFIRGTPINLVVCSKNIEVVSLLLYYSSCIRISCSNDWKRTRKKISNNTCIDNCKNISMYEYDGRCFDICPENNTNSIYIENENYCRKKCPNEKPFLNIDENICVDYCDLNDIINKFCILSDNLTNTQDIMLNNILKFMQNILLTIY